jgi:hypothetical protein
LQRFWEIEELPNKAWRTEVILCEEHFKKHTTQLIECPEQTLEQREVKTQLAGFSVPQQSSSPGFQRNQDCKQ